MTRRLSTIAVAAALLGTVVAAQGALVPTKGQRLGSTAAPNIAVGGDTDPASTAYRAWDQFVVVSGTESFTNIGVGQPNDVFTPSLTLASGVGTIECGDGFNPPFCRVQDTPEAGRYDTTGGGANDPKQFLHITATTDDPGSVVWNLTGVEAFSFMATDIGDFGGSFEIEVTRSNGTSTLTSTHSLASGGAGSGGSDSSTIISSTSPNGNLIFFGLYNNGQNGDAGYLFTKVVFKNLSAADGFALDDLRVGRFDPNSGGGGGTTPEPAGLALALAALGAAGIARRRRRG